MDATSPMEPDRIGVHDVGSRVVLRYRLPPDQVGPGGETLTDVIGVLRAWTGAPENSDEAGFATVVRASGEQVTVPLASIVAGKRLPPAQPRLKRPSANNPPR